MRALVRRANDGGAPGAVHLASEMDGRDCTITITCEKPQESDGDELYVLVGYGGAAARHPPDKKVFEMKAGSTASLKGREPTDITLYEADTFSRDDRLGEVALEPGKEATETVDAHGARYSVHVRWW